MDFTQYIRDVPDFPKQGIVFKDITPLLKDPIALKTTAKKLLELVGALKIDKVLGMESRGFFFAPWLAMQLGAGFVPVRKQGKLPWQTISETYALEYGEDSLELHADALQHGDRVLVHDDVLATGGTAAAVCRLVQKAGAQVVQCNFLLELDFLNGRDKLEGQQVTSLLHY